MSSQDPIQSSMFSRDGGHYIQTITISHLVYGKVDGSRQDYRVICKSHSYSGDPITQYAYFGNRDLEEDFEAISVGEEFVRAIRGYRSRASDDKGRKAGIELQAFEARISEIPPGDYLLTILSMLLLLREQNDMIWWSEKNNPQWDQHIDSGYFLEIPDVRMRYQDIQRTKLWLKTKTIEKTEGSYADRFAQVASIFRSAEFPLLVLKDNEKKELKLEYFGSFLQDLEESLLRQLSFTTLYPSISSDLSRIKECWNLIGHAPFRYDWPAFEEEKPRSIEGPIEPESASETLNENEFAQAHSETPQFSTSPPNSATENYSTGIVLSSFSLRFVNITKPEKKTHQLLEELYDFLDSPSAVAFPKEGFMRIVYESRHRGLSQEERALLEIWKEELKFSEEQLIRYWEDVGIRSGVSHELLHYEQALKLEHWYVLYNTLTDFKEIRQDSSLRFERVTKSKVVPIFLYLSYCKPENESSSICVFSNSVWKPIVVDAIRKNNRDSILVEFNQNQAFKTWFDAVFP